MIISLIVAMDRQRGIGFDNHLPWRLSADLKHFRELTTGHHLIVGRKTYESIGKPLPGRQMIVVTHNRQYQAPGCFIRHSIKEAIALACDRGENEVFVGGGAELYRQTIGVADRLYLTQVESEVRADAFFPDFGLNEWLIEENTPHAADEKNQYPFAFMRLVRRAPRNRTGDEGKLIGLRPS